MHGAHAAALEPRLEAEVEVRRVDADEQRHALAATRRDASARRMRDELGQVADDLDEAAHRQRLQRVPRLAAGRLHPRSGDADEAHARAGARARPAISVAASASPEASPATMPMVDGRVAAVVSAIRSR